MNIQETQKMNNMIEELTKHGNVMNFGDPLEIASNMYSDALPVNDQSSFQKVSEVEKPLISEERPAINEGHVNFMINEHLDQFKLQMNAIMQSKFDRLNEEIRSLSVQVRESKQMATAQEKEVKQETIQETIQPVVEKEDHPRNGGFTSSDVSMEKIFYSGNK